MDSVSSPKGSTSSGLSSPSSARRGRPNILPALRLERRRLLEKTRWAKKKAAAEPVAAPVVGPQAEPAEQKENVIIYTVIGTTGRLVVPVGNLYTDVLQVLCPRATADSMGIEVLRRDGGWVRVFPDAVVGHEAIILIRKLDIEGEEGNVFKLRCPACAAFKRKFLQYDVRDLERDQWFPHLAPKTCSLIAFRPRWCSNLAASVARRHRT